MSESLRSKYNHGAILLIVLGVIFHLAYSTHLELVGDEAYYWLWSRHPDICYLDKGPMIAWLIAAGTALCGQTVFGVRFFAVMLAGGTGLGMFVLARQLFSERVAFWTVAVGTVTPLFAAGASLMTIDTVYVFFWTWAAVAFWRAKDESHLVPWVLTGALIGLGLLSKYTAAIELISFGLFCLWHAPSRSHLRRPTFWAMLTTALLFLIPAVVWNVRHGWPTSDWLRHRGALDEQVSFTLSYLFVFFEKQAIVLSPLFFVGLVFVLFRRSLRTAQPATSYALALFLPLFAFYLILSFHYQGQPNWTAAAYIGGFILLTAKWTELAQTDHWAWWVGLAGMVFASIQTAILLETRWLHLPHALDPLDRARGSRSLAASIAQAQVHTGAQFVIADNYQTAALLSFYLPGQPETFAPITARPLNQLDVWPNYEEKHPSGDALLVAKRNRLSRALQARCALVEPLGSIEAVDAGRKVASYRLFLCRRARHESAP